MKRDYIDAEFEVVGDEKPNDDERIRWVGLLELAWYLAGSLFLLWLGTVIHHAISSGLHAAGI